MCRCSAHTTTRDVCCGVRLGSTLSPYPPTQSTTFVGFRVFKICGRYIFNPKGRGVPRLRFVIGSGGGPVAAECGPTGHNFSKGMAGQGRAECGQGRAGQGRAGQGRAGRAGQVGHFHKGGGRDSHEGVPAPEPASLTPRHARCCYSQRPQLAPV